MAITEINRGFIRFYSFVIGLPFFVAAMLLRRKPSASGIRTRDSPSLGSTFWLRGATVYSVGRLHHRNRTHASSWVVCRSDPPEFACSRDLLLWPYGRR